MPFRETGFHGLVVFEPKVFRDARGYFFESFNQKVFDDAGITKPFVQDNQSFSKKGTLRGLHYQLDPNAQSKLVRAIQGEVLDVVVDLRKGSPTFGKSYSILLSDENQLQLYVPRGFAHGYSVLSDTALFFYKCDGYYDKASERGIAYNDPELNIDWKVNLTEAIVSEKDMQNKTFREAEYNFQFQP
jgi:dTDP-4-dehydrorhamnose 3,5-epimerase